MSSNLSLFLTFQSNISPSNVTLANKSTSFVLGSKVVHPIPVPSLSLVVSLPWFSFILIFVRKLIRTRNCHVSFFPIIISYRILQWRRFLIKDMNKKVFSLGYSDA